MKRLKLDLSEQEARTVLEAFACLDLYMRKQIDSINDEDAKADVGNDLIAVRILAEQIQNQATELFGPNVLVQSYPTDQES
jgi:hypothetical protein